jgi:histidinol-phosphate aminotransferase
MYIHNRKRQLPDVDRGERRKAAMEQSAAWKIKSGIVRAEVAAAPSYNSGLTIDELVRRYNPPRISKLGSGENPFGASPRIDEALAALDVSLYPDPTGLALRAALAERLGVSSGRVVLGNGSEDLIEVVCRAVLRDGDEVVTLYPSFPLHEIYPGLQSARVTRVAVRSDFSIDETALHATVARAPRMLMFANPMNPVGSFLDRDAFARLCAILTPSTMLVLDEAYVEYADPARFPDALAMLADVGSPFIVLRTFSKAFGLAGLRLGYGVTSDDELTEVLDRVRTPFNVNSVAQLMGLVALADNDHVDKTVRHNSAERERVSLALTRLGARVAPSQGNFLFFSLGRPSVDLAEHLLTQGVIVKPWHQDGFSDFCRVTLGSADANDHFLDALEVVAKSI